MDILIVRTPFVENCLFSIELPFILAKNQWALFGLFTFLGISCFPEVPLFSLLATKMVFRMGQCTSCDFIHSEARGKKRKKLQMFEITAPLIREEGSFFSDLGDYGLLCSPLP